MPDMAGGVADPEVIGGEGEERDEVGGGGRGELLPGRAVGGVVDFAVPADGEAGGWGEHVDLLEDDGEESLEFEGGRGGGGVGDLVDGAGRRAGGRVFEGGGDPAGVGVGEADAVGVAVVGVRIGRDLADPGLGGPGGAGVGREVEAALGGDEAVAGGGAVDVVLDEVVGDVDGREVEAVGGAEDEVEGGAGEDGVGGAGPVGGVEEAAVVAAVGIVKLCWRRTRRSRRWWCAGWCRSDRRPSRCWCPCSGCRRRRP